MGGQFDPANGGQFDPAATDHHDRPGVVNLLRLGLIISSFLSNYTLTMVKNPCCTDTSRAIIRTESIDFSKSDTLLHSKKIIIKLNTSGTRTDKEMTTICYPYLTNNGIALIYELEGLLYFVGLNSPGE